MNWIKNAFGFIGRYFSLLVVAGVFVWSAASIALYRSQEAGENEIVIRLGHWQLEASVREGIDEMAKEYSELHARLHPGAPKITIKQDAIPEGTYGQWVGTQLMGGTAPDILQVGAQLPDNIWLSYYNRYFQPISRYAQAPNPYNATNELAQVPLRQTFKDGMKTAYVTEMQEYMSFPLSLFGVRIFYNKNLLKQLTGLDEAPLDYREFLAACEKIKSQVNPANGQAYIPIAGSAYHFAHWDSMMFSPVTYGCIRRGDLNRDAFVGNDETYVAFKTGALDFHYPPLACWLKMVREVTDEFQTGYTGLGRDEAVFLFAQQRAVFMTTGTWDARSLQEQAKGQFEVGIMDFPLPSADDPVYGKVVEGRIYESPGAGFRFAVTRSSQHFEEALDFLMFLSGKEGNEKLNKIIGWIPAIKGTEIDPLLKAFDPHLEGIYGAVSFTLGGNTSITWGQQYDLYKVNQVSFEDFAKNFTEYYIKNGRKDFIEQQKDWRRGMQRNEQYLAGIRARAILSDKAYRESADEGERERLAQERESAWVRYRAITYARQLWNEINHARDMKRIEQTELPEGWVGPYEYSDKVIARIRERLEKEAGAEVAPPPTPEEADEAVAGPAPGEESAPATEKPAKKAKKSSKKKAKKAAEAVEAPAEEPAE
ncbi:MAG: carbohydrate ABC transporter substrate-binding protein [Kiritimatiellae bacterium]|nr:carbohydrate ABC transporter substrate-binding protein [Kiritimatiellia bacterium]